MDKVEEFLSNIKYVEDTEDEILGLIKEYAELGEELNRKLNSENEEDRIEGGLGDTPQMVRIKYIVERLEKVASVVYFNGEICRLKPYAYNIPVNMKNNEPFSEDKKPVLNVYGISLVRIVGINNKIGVNSENYKSSSKLTISEGNTNVVLGANLFYYGDDDGRVSNILGDFKIPFSKGTGIWKRNSYYFKKDFIKGDVLTKEGTVVWVSYRGDAMKNGEDDESSDGRSRENLTWDIPRYEGFELKTDNTGLVEELFNTRVGYMLGQYQDKEIFNYMTRLDELDTAKFYKHRWVDLLRTEAEENGKTKVSDGVSLVSVPSIREHLRHEWGLISEYQMTLNVNRSRLRTKYLEDDNTREDIEEVLKESIFEYTAPNGYFREKFYYDEDRGVFESSDTRGTYARGINISEIIGTTSRLSVSQSATFKIKNIEIVQNEKATHRLRDGKLCGLIAPTTVYVYKGKDIESSVPVGVAPFKKGKGVLNENHGENVGEVQGETSLIKYVIDRGIPKAVTSYSKTPPASIYSNGKPVRDVRGFDKDWGKDHTELKELYPLKQGIFSWVDLEKGSQGYRIGKRSNRIALESKIEVEDIEKYLAESKSDEDGGLVDYGGQSPRSKLIELVELNEIGTKNFSSLLNNRWVTYGIYQDKDFTDSEIIEKYSVEN